MNKSNEKILTLSFAIFAFLSGFSLHLILKSFSGAFAIIARLNENDLFKHGAPVLFGFGLFLLADRATPNLPCHRDRGFFRPCKGNFDTTSAHAGIGH